MLQTLLLFVDLQWIVLYWSGISITNTINMITILQPSNFNVFLHGHFLQYKLRCYLRLFKVALNVHYRCFSSIFLEISTFPLDIRCWIFTKMTLNSILTRFFWSLNDDKLCLSSFYLILQAEKTIENSKRLNFKNMRKTDEKRW